MAIVRQRHNSFVLRIWWEQDDAETSDRPSWRGWVQHVQSGEAVYLRDVNGLLAFIDRWSCRRREGHPSAARLK